MCDQTDESPDQQAEKQIATALGGAPVGQARPRNTNRARDSAASYVDRAAGTAKRNTTEAAL